LTGGESLNIHLMAPADAEKLLFSIADEKRFDGRADELAALAGYLPMALLALASILAEDELETVDGLIERYRDKQELLKLKTPDYSNQTISVSFELSYEKLSEKLKKHWRSLSVFPADFDEPATASVLDISDEEASETQNNSAVLIFSRAIPKPAAFTSTI
jgi:hypothetical protein